MKSIKSFFNFFSDRDDQAQERHKLVGPPRMWRMKREFQINFLISTGLNPSHKFLDLGCGTLRGGIPIIKFLDEKGYWGLDVRQHVLDEALKELQLEGLNEKKPILLRVSNYSELEIKQKFDRIFAFSVLIHMSDVILGECLSFVSTNLSSTGEFFANVNIGEDAIREWQGFPVITHNIEFYQKIANNYGLLMTTVGTLESLGHKSGSESQDNQLMLKFVKMDV